MLATIGVFAFCPRIEAKQGFWELSVEVNGDANHDLARKPEPFVVRISETNKAVEALRSIRTVSPAAFLEPPFQPSAEQKKTLESAGDLAYLKIEQNLKNYDKICETLLTTVLPPGFSGRSRTRVLKNAGIIDQSFSHPVTVADLVAFQDWFYKSVVPFVKRNSKRFSLPTEAEEYHLPLLIHGTVVRSGTAPQYKIEFDVKDTIITAGAQNEAKDTTLYQLRTGMFDVNASPKANIGIHRILGVRWRDL